jgi:TetR/AcrR family transcriptional regulator, cholesterol catabolism regulator
MERSTDKMEQRIRGRSAEANAQRLTLVVEVARQLAIDGGPDAVQMRTVASLAQMTLVTLYRLAPSKSALLALVANDQVRRLAESSAEHPITAGTRGERAARAYKRVFAQTAELPNLGRAIFSVFSGVSVLDLEPFSETRNLTLADIVRSAVESDGVTVTPEEEKYLLMARLVWGGAVGEWLSGLLDSDTVDQMIDLAGVQIDLNGSSQSISR